MKKAMLLPVLLAIMLGLSLPTGLYAQAMPIIGILPDTRSLNPADTSLLRACAEGIRIAFTRRGILR